MEFGTIDVPEGEVVKQVEVRCDSQFFAEDFGSLRTNSFQEFDLSLQPLIHAANLRKSRSL
jgi:hypothetical protein